MTHPVFQAFLAQQAPSQAPSQVAGPHNAPLGLGFAHSNLGYRLDPCANLKNGTPLYGADGKVHFVCRNHHATPTTRWPVVPMAPTLGSFGVKLHPTASAIIGLNNLRRR